MEVTERRNLVHHPTAIAKLMLLRKDVSIRVSIILSYELSANQLLHVYIYMRIRRCGTPPAHTSIRSLHIQQLPTDLTPG
jgi:hypothetical protein